MLKELILICYLLCIILSVSGLTIALLVNRKNKKGISKNLAFFLIGILVICCYDMAIYYSDYVLGVLSNLKVLRIGNCLIADHVSVDRPAGPDHQAGSPVHAG